MGRTVFTNTNLLDGENPAQQDITVVVENNRISATGSVASPQQGDKVVNLTGLTLMPGMVSGHYHAAYSQSLAMDDTQTLQAIGALGNVQTALKYGYTSVVGAGTFFDIDARLSEAIDEDMVVGPRLTPCSRALTPSVVGPGAAEDSPYITNQGADAFRRAAQREIDAGARIIKIFAASGHALLGTRPMTEEEISAVVDLAHENNVRVRAHVGGRDNVLRCVKLGVDIIDHADGMDDEIIEAILDKGCFVLPSLYFGYLTSGDPSLPGAELYFPEDYEQMRGTLPEAANAGVKFVPGDDYGFGALNHGDYPHELACYVEQVGIDALDVIKWATKYGGEMTGTPDLGTIAPGMLADMVIVNGDPSEDINILSDLSRIVTVIKDGSVVNGQLPGALAS